MSLVPVEQDQPARNPRGSRSNGLPVTAWTAVADLDPRIADDVLITLHANGIGAYVEPTPAEAGGYRELRLPVRPTDRLFADAAAHEKARAIVTAELAESELAAERDDLGELLPEPPGDELAEEPDDHFHPPAPPPIPRLRPTTVAGLALIALGMVILLSGFQGGEFGIVGVIAIAAGVGSLVWHMQDGPPPDSGWDDGAVL